MSAPLSLGNYSKALRWALWPAAGMAFLALVWFLRHLSFSSDPFVSTYIEIIGGMLSFTFAASALVRYRGIGDRLSLLLALSFLLCGLTEAGALFGLYGSVTGGAAGGAHVPLTWMISGMALAIFFVAAPLVERRLPDAGNRRRQVIASCLVAVAVVYLAGVAYLGETAEPVIRTGAWVARRWDLLPAAIFLFAAMGFRRRLRANSLALDRALLWVAWINVACHVAASQSEHLLDAPFMLAQVLKGVSYAIVLGGGFLDNVRMFEQVRHQAVSDPLTGLANYRCLLQTLEGELQRSRRTGRPFAVLLLDLDGLKSINDRYGHLVGSRALCRLARILQLHSRAMDTAARYGGDEFVLVLPEANGDAAASVARRICQRLAADGETPTISVSAGAAVFPADGETMEKLLAAADHALYRMKVSGKGILDFSRIAACL